MNCEWININHSLPEEHKLHSENILIISFGEQICQAYYTNGVFMSVDGSIFQRTPDHYFIVKPPVK